MKICYLLLWFRINQIIVLPTGKKSTRVISGVRSVTNLQIAPLRDCPFQRYSFQRFPLLEIPLLEIPPFRDSLFQRFPLLEIPPFKDSLFQRLPLLEIAPFRDSSFQRFPLLEIPRSPFPVPRFLASPFLVLEIAKLHHQFHFTSIFSCFT